jgi:hypothetical protein
MVRGSCQCLQERADTEKLLVEYDIDRLLHHTNSSSREVYTCFYEAAEVGVVMRTRRRIGERVKDLANDFGTETKEMEMAREPHNSWIVTGVVMAKVLEYHSIPCEMVIALALGTARVHYNSPCVMVIAPGQAKARVHHNSRNVTVVVVEMERVVRNTQIVKAEVMETGRALHNIQNVRVEILGRARELRGSPLEKEAALAMARGLNKSLSGKVLLLEMPLGKYSYVEVEENGGLLM